ncbi:MAG: glycine cleavage system protein GcvH [Alphaproteobacteria bacterium]
MSELKYSEEHEWLVLDGDVATIGITDHAQGQLGDIVYVELPEVGVAVAQGDDFAVVESVKAASEVYAPVDGEIIEVNETLSDVPETVNNSPEDEGWFVKIKLSDPKQTETMMDREAYDRFAAESS